MSLMAAVQGLRNKGPGSAGGLDALSCFISSAESQNGAIADQRCSIENQKGAIAIDFVL